MDADPLDVDQMPPHSLDAECSILGAMLRDPNADATNLAPDDFYVYANRRIFAAIGELRDKGQVAHVTTVFEHLSAARALEDAGGAAYLAKLVAEVSSAALVPAGMMQLVGIVRRHAIARNMLYACVTLAKTGQDPSLTADELIAEADQAIKTIVGSAATDDIAHVSETIAVTWRALDERRARRDARYTGIPSGFVELDALTAGFQDGDFIVIAARPSCGKTALAVNIARHVAVEEGAPVLFISMEQSSIELTERLLCTQAHADGHRLRTGRARATETTRLFGAGEMLGEHVRTWTDRDLHIIVGMKRSKDAEGFLRPLLPHATTLWAVAEPGQHLAQPVEEIVAASGGIARPGPTVADALRALPRSGAPARVLICGSLYLAGEVLKADGV